MAEPAWCRACGSGSTGDGACTACGTALDPPEAGAGWPGRGGVLRRGTRRLAGAPLGVRRAAAIDLIAQRRPLPAELGLSEHEIAWYRAHAALTAGDLPAALAQLAILPDTGYAARVGLLLSRFRDLLATRDCWAAAVAVLMPFVPRSADAEAMVTVLDPTTGDVVEVARRCAGPGLGDGPRARALAAYRQTVAGEAPGVPGDLLPLLPPALLDRLAVIGALTRPPDGLPEPAATRLRCRLGLAGPEEMAGAGFTAEAARRAYLAGDGAAFDRLGDGPDVRHYRALHDYVTARRLREEDLRPQARAVVRLTDTITIGFAGRRPVPAEVAADPTTWPRLWPNAVLNKLYPADGVAERYPGFALWLELCTAYPALRAGRWSQAREIAAHVHDAAPDPRLRDEARNVAAYACWQLGLVDDALHELGRAAPGAGYAVNAVLVVSSRGPAAALPYLAQVMRLTGDEGLRRTAVRTAVDLGERDGRASATLVAIIRAALDQDSGDDLHQRLLALSLRHDRAWLAHATLRSRRDDDRYYRGRAAYEEEPATVALSETATALGRLWPGPAWVQAEARWLTAVLAGPPEAVDALPAVEALHRGGVLTLADRIRLRAVAGTRQIATVDWSPRPGRPLPGETALARAVDEYRRHADDLEPGMLADIEDLLAGEVISAALTAGNAAIRHWNGLEERFEALARSAGRTWEENQPNAAARRQLINDMEAHVNRSERLLRLADGLAVDHRIRTDIRAFHDKARETIPHLRRRAI